MKTETIHISDDFSEVGTRAVDTRERVCLGDFVKGFKRVRVYQNAQGEILIRPVIEIPASELWLYKNKKALASVLRGLKQAAEGKVSKLDLKEL